MRIGIITGEFPPMQGGIGAYSERLAGHLMAAGQKVFVLSAENTMPTNADIHLISVVARWNAKSWLQARVWAQRNDLDLISLQYQTAAFAMSPFIHFFPDIMRPRPVVTTFHDLRFPYLFPLAGSLRARIVQHLARASAGCITTNAEDEAQLADIPHKAIIPIGSNLSAAKTDEGKRQAIRDHLLLAADDYLIGYFGLTNRSKGLDMLLGSIIQLRQQGISAHLLIIGGTAGANDPTNRAYRGEIERLIEDGGIQEVVHETGYIDDATAGAYLQAVDAVALPYRDGASARRGSLLAALQHGCAIVTTTPTTPAPEFADGDTMLLVAAEDSGALTAALKRLHDESTLRAKISAGAERASQRFGWAGIAQAHIAFFARVLEQVN